MVRYFGYRVCYYSIGYSDVPGPQLVQLVAPLMGRRSLSQCRFETGLHKGGVHFVELPIQIPAQDNLSSWVLPNDALS